MTNEFTPCSADFKEDGLYHSGPKGRKGNYLFVKNGAMWMPTSMMSAFMVLTSGARLRQVDGRLFMRAADLVEAWPQYFEALMALATKHGLTL
jgi:hypothetical protein